MAKRKHGGSSVWLIAVVLVAIVATAGYFLGWFDRFLGTTEPTTEPTGGPVVESGELSVHFLELGNAYTGDSVYIKVGDVDILIDAGSRKNSVDAIETYVRQYCTDGTLEYVVATHAHQDHIAGFVGPAQGGGIFERFDCGTIIDFPRTDATSQIYRDYVRERDAEVARGAKHYTALECYDNKNGGQRIYTLAEGVTMEILYNYFYEHPAEDENDYSVCLILHQGNNHYLFTGDLEAEGEKWLIAENNLPHCVLFKAGHHGSYSSTSYALLDEITPEVIAVCCCCGSDEYTTNVARMFPAQEFCTRVSEYTDRVYVTSVVADNDAGYTSLNGTIVFSSSGGAYEVHCSNNDTLFRDSEWCKRNRVWGD